MDLLNPDDVVAGAVRGAAHALTLKLLTKRGARKSDGLQPPNASPIPGPSTRGGESTEMLTWLRRKAPMHTPEPGEPEAPALLANDREHIESLWPSPPTPPGDTESRAYKKWTPDEDNILRAGHRDRLPLAVIAENLGRTKSAVVGRMLRLMDFDCPDTPDDYKPSHHGEQWMDADDADLVAGWRAGNDSAVLAQRFGRSQKSVKIRLLHLHEVSLPPGPTS